MSEYSEILKHPNWQRKRLEILSRDNYTCKFCKVNDETLHVHHKHYIYGKKPWEYPDDNFITLCWECHEMCTVMQKECKHTIEEFFICPDSLMEINKILKFLSQFTNPIPIKLFRENMEQIQKNNNYE